jgi:RNA polymerase sporulation-specific sigma factor
MRTVEERNTLIEENIKLVFYCFNRLHKDRFVEKYADDLKQEGMLGLMKAANTFDSEKGRFSTYAILCIRNEMFMFMRKMRKSFDREISLYTPVGLDAEGSEVYLIDTIPCNQASAEDEMECKDAVQFINEQSPRNKSIMKMRVDGLTMTEIGKVLGISQSYVSRILRNLHQKYLKSEGFNGN